MTGKILQIDRHPDADKLVVCQVDMGDEQLQIVTAATNVRVGQIVPVAVHGAHLPGGTKIKRSKLRGVLSNGMFCSAHEFGFDDSLLLPEEKEGIWILPADTPLGVDAAEYMQVRDVVYEYELTANRADCFSMVGLSREFAALSGKEARYPEISVKECDTPIDGKVKISIDDEELCSRYTARLLLNVKIGNSPLWMQQRLRKYGVRPINNVVDATNYAMIELGIPLHAYDYDHVADHHLIARRAKDGEEMKTLDDTDRTLTDNMLVIADPEKPAALPASWAASIRKSPKIRRRSSSNAPPSKVPISAIRAACSAFARKRRAALNEASIRTAASIPSTAALSSSRKWVPAT